MRMPSNTANNYCLVPNGDSTDLQNENVLSDGVSRIDYVLVYDIFVHIGEPKIKIFEENLRREGLILEDKRENHLVFTKIHAPKSALKRNCEIMKLRMPVKADIRNKIGEQIFRIKRTGFLAKLKFIIGFILHIFCVKTKYLPKAPHKLTEEYSRNKSFIFDDSADNFFSLSDRCMIVNFILERVSFTPEEPRDVGISKLLETGIYKAAYPPHEGTLYDPVHKRGELVNKWASWSNTFKFQPLDEIKDYFGMKCALYFAWIGFYTDMLVIASILSGLFLLYGVCTWSSDYLSNEICHPESDVIMCPPCDNNCDYWSITDACWFYKFRYLIDNDFTPLYVFLMSIWSAVYLKRWQQYSAEIKHRWGLTLFTLFPETIRSPTSVCCPSCQGKSNKYKLHRFMKLPCIFFSYSIVLFSVSIAAICVFLTVLYSMALIASEYIHGEIWTKYNQSLWVPITSGLIYYVLITIINTLYNSASQILTEWEFHRTQAEFENSLYLKIYVFQFVNYYFIFFYLAFIKGKLIGHPADYIRILGYRQEECEPGGCLMEICIQIVIFMAAEQFRDNIVEYTWPLMKQSWSNNKGKKYFRRLFQSFAGICSKQKEKPMRWFEDYKLNPWDNNILFDEYLEMVIQYGYIAIFVAACPLAPILALFNNLLIEIRLDAKKFIKFYRRPVAQRVPDIGIWFFVLNVVAKLSIYTNAWIIASSTNLIPLWMYKMKISHNFTTAGFVNHSLSYFDINDFENGSSPSRSMHNVTSCRYFDYRKPFGNDGKYEKSLEYWHILVAKLVFIIVYKALVSSVVTIINWWSPNMPKQLMQQIKKEETYISQKILHYFEPSVTDSSRNEGRSVPSTRRNSTPIYNGRGSSM